jgi:cytidylate kinase
MQGQDDLRDRVVVYTLDTSRTLEDMVLGQRFSSIAATTSVVSLLVNIGHDEQRSALVVEGRRMGEGIVHKHRLVRRYHV